MKRLSLLPARLFSKALLVWLLIGFSNMVNAQKLSSKQEKYYQQQILVYINQYRSNKGLNALALNDGLNTIALSHSRNMCNGSVAFGHDGFNGRMSQAKRINPNLRGFAENVAYGMQTPQEVSQDWYGSSGHRRNLLGDFSLTGIGVERGSDGYLYFTQIFEK